jgi:hypothetical protein
MGHKTLQIKAYEDEEKSQAGINDFNHKSNVEE